MSENTIEVIYQILHGQRKKKLRLTLVRGLLLGLAMGAGLFLFLVLVDILFSPDPPVRKPMVLASTILVVGIFLWLVARPFLYFLLKKHSFSDLVIASEIGDHRSEIKDELLNTLQLVRIPDHLQIGYSQSLIEHAARIVAEKLASVDLGRLYPVEPVRQAGRWLITPLLTGLILIGILPNSFRNGLKHILWPGTQFKPTPVESILVSPGDCRVVEGDSVRLTAELQGNYQGEISLVLQEETRESPETIKIFPDSGRTYHYLLRNLRQQTRYAFEAEGYHTPTFTVQVEKRPFARRLSVRLLFPAYTQLPPLSLEENVGDVTALAGTRVLWKIEANKPLKTAAVEFTSGRSLPLSVSGNRAEGQIILKKDDQYKIRLVDQFDYTNENPIEYTLQTLADQIPLVEITLPGKDIDLTEEMKLPLAIEAEDDFGFSRLRIGYRVESNNPGFTTADTTFSFFEIPLPTQQEPRIAVNHLWDLVNLTLMPEDVLYYFAEVWDNDQVSGPKRGMSRIYSARFPSMIEIMNEVSAQEDDFVEELQTVLEKHKELKERLNELQRELLQQDRVDWLKKKDLEEIAARQEALQQNVEEVKKQIEEMVDRLESNRMLSVETLQKYQELQQLMSEIMTPELQEAIKKLQQAMEKMNESLLKQSLSNMQLSEENLLRNLDRTIELLKRLQAEQKMDQAIKITENLAQRQEMVNEQLNSLPPEQLPNILQQEQKIAEDTQSLDALFQELDRSLREDVQFHSSTMDSLLTEIQRLQQQLRNSQEQMQQGQIQKALQSGQLSEQQMRQMLSQLQQMKSDFLQNQKQAVMKEFTKASGELLKLSRAQEDLLKQTQELSSVSPRLGEIADQQQQQLRHLNRVADQLYQLSQKTFFVTPEIGQGLGKSFSGMKGAVEQLEQRNPKAASSRQSAALSGLNETLMQIQRSMQNLQSASSAVGMEEFMRRLEQMAGKQQGINQQTLQLSMQQGQMTLQQQAAMARLVAEQQALKKSLEELQREFGNRSEITGRLDGIAREMEKVIEDLQRKRVSPATINRQRRILSRMLDAQRSLHERDYSRKRQATPGKTYFIRSPKALGQEIQEKKARFLEDLLRARRAGFNPEYLDLIRRYFQAISKIEQNRHE